MQNRRLIIIGIILAVVLGLLISNYVGLFGEDYGTGLNINTETRKFEFKGNYQFKGKKFLYTDPNWEQLDGEVYITSWQPNGDSVKILSTAKFHFKSWHDPWWGYKFGLGQYYWMVQYEDVYGHIRTIINGLQNWYDRDFVKIIRGDLMGNLPNCRYGNNNGEYNVPSSCNIFGPNTWTEAGSYDEDYMVSRWVTLQTDTLAFTIKGNHIGAIRVYCVLETVESGFWYGEWHSATVLISEDWAYLASGVGKVDVLGTGAIRNEGTEYTPETNRPYTVYVFEEGSTVTFSVDAMYSGATLNPNQEGYGKGWSLRLYDGSGRLKESWSIPDDVRGYTVTYTIPEGSFVPGGNNRWKVVLMNTLFDQSETEIFVVDKLEKIPGKTAITTDKPEYNQGDIVTVTLTANANPNGTGDIAKFYVWAKYDSPSSTDYAYSPHYIQARHVSGLKYQATFSFIVSKPDKWVYIRAFAIDSEGRAGEDGECSFYVKQVYGNYKITVFVKEPDGTPISNAKVTIGQIVRYTGNDGKSIFYLQKGDYQMTVSKAGYSTYRGSVYVNADKTITVTISPVVQPPSGWIFYLIVAIVVTIALYVGVVIYKKYKRR